MKNVKHNINGISFVVCETKNGVAYELETDSIKTKDLNLYAGTDFDQLFDLINFIKTQSKFIK